MAIETPTAPSPGSQTTLRPETVTRSQESSPAPSLKPEGPPRTRNEYPGAFDELEELDRSSKASLHDNGQAKPKPAAATKPRDESGKFTKREEDEPADVLPKHEEKTVPDKEPEIDGDTKPAAGKETSQVTDDSDPASQFKTAHDLRKDWRKKREALIERESEITRLRQQLEQRSPESKTLVEENKRMKARLEEVEAELRYADYTKSSEFKEKFEKPYQDAYHDAVEEVRELRVQLPDGQSRPASEQDFQRIIAADSQDVRALASEMFGDAAHDVLSLRRRLNELNRTANREAKRYREQAAEREREKTLKMTEQREQTDRLWKQANETIVQRYGDFFAPKEGDDDYNKTLESGYSTVDRAFQPGLAVEERISRQAALRHKAAAFGAQVLLNKRLKERVAELEGVIKEYEKSAPGPGKGGTEGQRMDGAKPKSAFDEIDELARLDPADR